MSKNTTIIAIAAAASSEYAAALNTLTAAFPALCGDCMGQGRVEGERCHACEGRSSLTGVVEEAQVEAQEALAEARYAPMWNRLTEAEALMIEAEAEARATEADFPPASEAGEGWEG